MGKVTNTTISNGSRSNVQGRDIATLATSRKLFLHGAFGYYNALMKIQKQKVYFIFSVESIPFKVLCAKVSETWMVKKLNATNENRIRRCNELTEEAAG